MKNRQGGAILQKVRCTEDEKKQREVIITDMNFLKNNLKLEYALKY